MRFFTFSVLIVIQCIGFTTFAAKLPKDWTRCYVNSKNSSECFTPAIQMAIKKLGNNAPELGITSFEPLLISEMTIGEGTGPVNVAQHFKNIKLHGMSDSKIISQLIDLPKNIFTAVSITPMLRLEAEYTMSGRVLLLPIQGNGPCNITLINTKINHTLISESFTKKGKEYLRFTDYTVTLRPEKMIFKFDNLFNGQDKRLGDELNKVLNDNWDAVFTDIRSGYEASFGFIFKDLANRVFNRVPVKDIFLFEA